MAVVYRTCKAKYPPLDGTGAWVRGGRWNSPGRLAVYAAASYANTLLEILVHRGRTIPPGAHHVAQLEIPDELIESVVPDAVPGWDHPDAPSARAFGDRWIDERRSVALVVPAVVGRPFERNVVLNPDHPDFGRVRELARVPVAWDGRLFGR